MGVTGRRERCEVVEALLCQVNLYDVRRKKLGSYSGGMRQRFGVAVALLADPRLIIVDKPTAGASRDGRMAGEARRQHNPDTLLVSTLFFLLVQPRSLQHSILYLRLNQNRQISIRVPPQHEEILISLAALRHIAL